MAREPSYPDDAPVGSSKKEGQGEAASAASAAASVSGSDKGGGDKRKHLMTGAAIGIGSAALVAALLYANRGRKDRA